MKRKKSVTHEIRYTEARITNPETGEVLSALLDARLLPIGGGKERILHTWSEIEQLVKTSTRTIRSSLTD